ncbi:MAG TPA: LysR substrate-binding domain-containing protein [Thermomicrobiales bacterium]|nr:LysR substrate-binding domain-containing protein [Thermomicrobiales bacterium]
MRASLPNLRQLEQFIAVAEELHFGRAAARLHMQQAPLSQAIQKLEVALGMQLFERTHRSVTLTPAGAALLDEARGLIRRGREFTRLASGLSQGELGRLTVGFVSTAMYGDLPGIVRTFGEGHPRVDLQLRETTSDVQVRQLESGELDIGLLLGELPQGIAAIRSRMVRTESLIVALPTSWEASRFATGVSGDAALEVLHDESLLTIPRRVGPPLYDAILTCFRERGLRPRFGQEAIQMQTILGLTAAGLGYAIVPDSMRMLARPDVRFLDIAGGAPHVELRVAWRASDPNPLTHDFVRLATAESPNRAASSA